MIKTGKKKFYQFTKRQVKDILTYDVKGRVTYSKEDHLKLLLSACLINGFAEGVSKSLNRSPTGETLLSYIKTQDREKLLQAFDRMVQNNARILKRCRKLVTPVPVAIDWHDIMHYGDPIETPMVIGTQHKNGSNYAFEYLTASVLVDGERLVVAVIPLESRSDAHRFVKKIVEKVKELGIRIRCLTLDGGFFSIDTMRFLKESGLKYILHMPSTRKIKKMKLHDCTRLEYRTNHHQRRESEQVSFDVVVAYDRAKNYNYLLATNMPSSYKSSTLLKLYNRRWGIETSYRMCNQFLIRTTSKKYVVRLFYYLFACLIYNVWVMYNEQNTPLIVVQMKLSLLWFVLNDDYMLEYT